MPADKTTKTKPRRGRPPIKSGKPKRASFNTRLRDETKRGLEAAAEASGRSLSEEIEFRLEQSFRDASEMVRFEGSLMRLFGGMDNLEIGSRFVSLLEYYEAEVPGWRDNEKWTRVVAQAAARYVERLGSAKNEPIQTKSDPDHRGPFRQIHAQIPSAIDILAKRLADGEYLPRGDAAWRAIEKAYPVADDDETED